MALKPWYTDSVMKPREDLRTGKPLDASEFAVHLDQVRDGTAPDDYKKPAQFFERTYLTQNLMGLGSEVIRRLSGERTETSAVFNLITQFGGGKTHALTLLYHLMNAGSAADRWAGVDTLLTRAGVRTVPSAQIAVFVGTEFDSLKGRGGDDGTPERKTPWGEIAYQLRGKEGLAIVAEHERQMIAPGGDVIRALLSGDRPYLILMDEIMNYISRNRRSGLSDQVYNFLHNLSETVRGMDRAVLVVSIPKSEGEMTAEDHGDYQRLLKMLERLSKALIVSQETETSEIIRRRLFEWDASLSGQGGRMPLSREALQTCNEYANWAQEHRQQLPAWFPVDTAREEFAATYPFHPMVLSVFERKWRTLPGFQQTRGTLRLLALWVSKAYQEGYKGAHRDPLIGLGTAPLDDALFRGAVFGQLGESERWEGVVTTDIAGKRDSHALRLDDEAAEGIKKARLHRKVATSIFFESSGDARDKEATVADLHLAVAGPDTDIGYIDTVLETLASACYFLTVDRNRYRFSLSPNLNKIFADKLANVSHPRGGVDPVDELVRAEVQKVFKPASSLTPIYFPERSNAVPDRAALTLIVTRPDQPLHQGGLDLIETITRQAGESSRTFKSALIWCAPDNGTMLYDDARKALAWEAIEGEDEERLDETQKRQLKTEMDKAHRRLTEAIWRTYRYLVLLGKDNRLREIDLGQIHSSASEAMVTYVVNQLRSGDEITDQVNPNFLLRNWPPAFKEWPTRSVSQVFFASPQFPRLLNPNAIKETIAQGVREGKFAYVGKRSDSDYDPFYFVDPPGADAQMFSASQVELSDDMYIVTKDTAKAYIQAWRERTAQKLPTETKPDGRQVQETNGTYVGEKIIDPPPPPPPSPSVVAKLKWAGEVPVQKWTNFYTKVLGRFVSGARLKLTVHVEIESITGIPTQKMEEMKVALRELGLNDQINIDQASGD